jgi:hypothetical protein
MLSGESIKKMICITIFIDYLLLYCLLNFKLNSYDRYFIIISLISHPLFIYYLVNYNKKIINFLHILIFILIGFGLFLQNRYLIIIPFMLVVIIQLLWHFEKKCILNEENETWGYNNTIFISTLIISYLYVWKLSKMF